MVASDPATSAVPTTSPETTSPSIEPEPTPSATRSLLAPPTDEDLTRVGQLFVRFARGDQPAGPPVDTPVLLLLGGQPVRTISAREALEPSSWEGLCPTGAQGYAGRTCPFSVVAPLAQATQPITFSMDPAQHSCAHPTPVTPAEVGAARLVTVVPDATANCLDYVGVELYVNDVGQIVAANVVWAEP